MKNQIKFPILPIEEIITNQKQDPSACIFCGHSTSLGTGLFIDRSRGDRNDYDKDIYLIGFICRNCIDP